MRTLAAIALGAAIIFVAVGHNSSPANGIGAPASPVQGTPVTSTPTSTTTTAPQTGG